MRILRSSHLSVLFSVLFTLTIVGEAAAARIERPYTVEMPVASQSPEDRNKASAEALQRLVMRLSGQQQARDHALVKAAAGQIDSYVQQFSYQAAPDGGKLLRLQFAAPVVDQLMHAANLPLWPLDRPAVLVVLVTGDEPQLWLQPDSWTSLAVEGNQRGVPVIAPVAVQPALQQAGLSARNVSTLDLAGIDALATAAGADAVLLGSLHDNGGADAGNRWQGKWLLHHGGRDQRFELRGADLLALADTAFVRTADALSQQYRGAAGTDSAVGTVHLEVAGVSSYADYTTVRSYIEKLDVVSAVKVVQVSGSTLKLDVSVRGREGLRNLLGMAHFLRFVEDATPPPAAAPAPAASAPAQSTPAQSTPAPSAVAPSAAPVPPVEPLWKYQWSGNTNG